MAGAGEGFGEDTAADRQDPLVICSFSIQKTRCYFASQRNSSGAFWPAALSLRAVVLANMAQRLQTYQVEALHREKLVSLGTLAAGLMHELHNPGVRRQTRRLATARKPAAPAGAEPA